MLTIFCRTLYQRLSQIIRTCYNFIYIQYKYKYICEVMDMVFVKIKSEEKKMYKMTKQKTLWNFPFLFYIIFILHITKHHIYSTYTYNYIHNRTITQLIYLLYVHIRRYRSRISLLTWIYIPIVFYIYLIIWLLYIKYSQISYKSYYMRSRSVYIFYLQG